jgi:fructose-bisphosphate aldolase class I
MDGSHTIERCAEVSEEALMALFHQLYLQRVDLRYTILKPAMVLSGRDCPKQASVDEVAEKTVSCLLTTVPAVVGGVAFLSGGQPAELATARLNAMHARYKSKLPWPLTFSYSRAVQKPCLELWAGKDENVVPAQKALYHRAKMNSAARRGEYKPALEKN